MNDTAPTTRITETSTVTMGLVLALVGSIFSVGWFGSRLEAANTHNREEINVVRVEQKEIVRELRDMNLKLEAVVTELKLQNRRRR